MRIKNQGEQKIKQKVKTEIMKETGQKGTVVKKEKAKNREKGKKKQNKRAVELGCLKCFTADCRLWLMDPPLKNKSTYDIFETSNKICPIN